MHHTNSRSTRRSTLKRTSHIVKNNDNFLSVTPNFLSVTPSIRKTSSILNTVYSYVRICSINANTKVPQTDFLDGFLGLDNKAEIIALGIQELTFKARDVALGLKSVNLEMSQWIDKIMSVPRISESFTLYKTCRFGSLLLIVLVKTNVLGKAKDPRYGSLGLGGLGMANKGCVAISMVFNSLKLIFITTHFAAGPQNETKRAQHFKSVITELKLTSGKNTNNEKEYSHILDCDFDGFFIFGDFNFRMVNISAYNMNRLINKQTSVDSLLEMDEFRIMSKEEEYYKLFSEGKIRFYPTYKFLLQSDDYNLKITNRSASYTDRILFRGYGIKCLSYDSHNEIKFSDHRPISGCFHVIAKRSQSSSFTRPDIFKCEDNILIMKPRTIDFGMIYFLESTQRTAFLQNNFSEPVYFDILAAEKNDRLPSWLTIFPTKGVIRKNASIKIIFYINIPNSEVHKFNMGFFNIHGTALIIQVLNSSQKVQFSLTGEFMPTLLGLPLSLCCCLTKPVKEYSITDLVQMQSLMSPNSRNIREKYKPDESILEEDNTLVMQNGIYTRSLVKLFSLMTKCYSSLHRLPSYLDEGNHVQLRKLREMLDSNTIKEHTDISSSSILELILIFLSCLPSPLIPIHLQSEFYNISLNWSGVMTAFNSLPATNRYLLDRLIYHMCHYVNIRDQVEIAYISRSLAMATFQLKSNTPDEINDNLTAFFTYVLTRFVLECDILRRVRQKWIKYISGRYKSKSRYD